MEKIIIRRSYMPLLTMIEPPGILNKFAGFISWCHFRNPNYWHRGRTVQFVRRFGRETTFEEPK
jgi:hypothetical protein